MKRYIILSVIFFVICLILLYFIIKYYLKKKFINDIIKEWKNRTNGNIKKDGNITSELKGDYFLDIDNIDDNRSHVHFITHNINVKYKNGKYYFEKEYENSFYNNFLNVMNLEFYYVPKKEGIHPEKITNGKIDTILYKIDVNKSPEENVEDMLKKFEKFFV
jgi:hypothetical protein